ncbi:lysylphosphatidylglycerol synthase transmembrane domain-containing protein [Natronobiforma cellulositropha]|uniref:lysylphosphatidylglycerol synthase transmembrane domain-containing protein n=1 Tax=Natronobiforma cellulositropha TaxID=1679076 RepID=UPI0021D59D79|nr:lysylphosphatidylglycerol synthase transmembrane domain-containing protein [Natronobiforma cellulositropha]
MKRRAALALVLALGVLGVLVLAVGWEEVFEAIGRASPETYALAFVSTGVCFACRSAVWYRVLAVVDQPRPYWLVGSVFLTASFAKYVTPYGQVTSGVGVAAIVSRYTDTAYEESLAAIISADILNYLPYYTFGFLSAVYVVVIYSPPVDLGTHALPIVALVGVIATVGLVLATQRALVLGVFYRFVSLLRRGVARVSERAAARLTRENVERKLEGFYTTLSLVSRDRRSMTVALVYAHLGWLALATTLYLSALALDAPVAFGVAMLVLAVSKLGFLVPTPGGLGGVEATIATALVLLTPTTVTVAAAIALLFRFATYWLTVLVGGGTSVALTVTDPLPAE